ncbi:MAG TPA: hydroxymethylbilane synthase [Pseudogracilibacillus sp.]|nr:hydroxymethylbilane synthase [Pseudogracilibacillus sp.]
MRELIVGSRESKLAMIQTHLIIDKLKEIGINYPIKIEKIATKGDKILDVALDKVGGTGIFIEDLETLLQNKKVDFAVHSMKDLSPDMNPEFTIAAVPEREDPRDALISKDHIKLSDLKEGAVIGTSSARRGAQIKAIRPDLNTKWIRGPIDSRIEQLNQGDFDAIILAVAGLNRMNLSEKVITEYLEIDRFVPSVAQGALAIQCRADDEEMIEILKLLNDKSTEQATKAERYTLSLLDEDDKAPIGVYANFESDQITIYLSIASLNGTKLLITSATGNDYKVVAKKVADELIAQGALDIIENSKRGK